MCWKTDNINHGNLLHLTKRKKKFVDQSLHFMWQFLCLSYKQRKTPLTGKFFSYNFIKIQINHILWWWLILKYTVFNNYAPNNTFFWKWCILIIEFIEVTFLKVIDLWKWINIIWSTKEILVICKRLYKSRKPNQHFSAERTYSTSDVLKDFLLNIQTSVVSDNNFILCFDSLEWYFGVKYFLSSFELHLCLWELWSFIRV